jgi:hypothetical protein
MESWKSGTRVRVATVVVAMTAVYLAGDVASGYVNSALGAPSVLFLPLVAAVPVPFTLVFGASAAVGAVVGSLAVGVTAFGVETVFVALAHGCLALTAAGSRDRLVTDRGQSLARYPESLRAFVTVSVLGSGGAAAVLAWGYEVAAIAPCFVAVASWFLSLLLVNLTVAPLVFFTLRSVAGWAEWSPPTGVPVTVRDRRTAVVVSVWVVLGSFGSIGYRLFETTSTRAVPTSLEFLFVFKRPDLFGAGAGLVEVLLGAVMFSFLALSYGWERD